MDDEAILEISDSPVDSRPKMGMMTFLATEGGRKCPQCGKYAKPSQLGPIGGSYTTLGGVVGHISMYGHLPGYGCNK